MSSIKKQPKVRISTRQRTVLSCLAVGLTMNEIAKRLKIAPGTAAMHRRKLGLAFHPYGANVVLLLRAAVQAGELPADVLARSADELDI
jgi:FixJ family two-component response regulator